MGGVSAGSRDKIGVRRQDLLTESSLNFNAAVIVRSRKITIITIIIITTIIISGRARVRAGADGRVRVIGVRGRGRRRA